MTQILKNITARLQATSVTAAPSRGAVLDFAWMPAGGRGTPAQILKKYPSAKSLVVLQERLTGGMRAPATAYIVSDSASAPKGVKEGVILTNIRGRPHNKWFVKKILKVKGGQVAGDDLPAGSINVWK